MKSNDEFVEEMVDAYPLLYRKVNRRGFISFEIGQGWYDIIRKLSAKLENYIMMLPLDEQPKYYVVQVKEKFGSLRFYMDGPFTNAMDAAIREAETATRTTCEVCGGPGEMRSGGWIQVRCDHHTRNKVVVIE